MYELFRAYAYEAKRAGRKKFSARTIGERVRWDLYIDTWEVEEYKVNDHYWPAYARLLIKREPEFAPFFELRKSYADTILHRSSA